MAITIALPAEVEAALRLDVADLDADARETYAAELYRRGKLTHRQLSSVLDLDRFETEGVLKRHRVFEDLPGYDELAQEARELKALLIKSD
jgi:hypothetical protein